MGSVVKKDVREAARGAELLGLAETTLSSVGHLIEDS
jgi:hypothetical protein